MKKRIKCIIPRNWEHKEENDSITIWYKTLNKSPIPLTIKKQIKIDEKLGIFLGFWAGDGGKKLFSLTNNNTRLLKSVYNIMVKSLGSISLKLRIMITI